MFKPFKDFISGSDNGDAFDDISNIREYLRKTIYDHISAGPVTKSNGVGGGHVIPPLMMDEGVFISGMSGAQAYNGGDPSIHMISFKDSDDNTMTGGMTADTPFNWPLPKGRFVLGFFGRTNDGGIRALGVHNAEFSNAKWS